MSARVLLSLFFVTLFASCGKDDKPAPIEKAKAKNGVTLDFSNYVGNEKLRINTAVYKNQNGNDMMITKIIYFISNIRLQNADGSEYVHPGYYPVSEMDEGSLSIEMENLPDGNYRSVSFMIGVDSVANKYALASGQLNLNDEMFLNAKDGYIMVNMEGISPASHQPEYKFIFHIGGATGATNVVKPVSFHFPEELVVNNNFKHIRIKTDLLKMFGPDYVVDFAALSAIYAPGDNALVIAHNYKTMMSLSGVGD